MNVQQLLGELSPQQFLQQYWQKKPLLIRNALPEFRNPLSPDELAGLACEESVESRIILERGGTHPWEIRHGPFEETDFSALPESHWTLLVQDVEKHLPELEQIVSAFHFIPHWRIDDLMISYAPTQGSVGPHADDYDVFLLQGMGQRRWQISRQPLQRRDLIPGLELEILARFEHEQEWTLNPGDMLYLPPGVIHHGVALNDCMTYSIGFRAPRQYDLVHSYLEHVLDHTDTGLRYADPELEPSREPYAISPQALDALHALLQNALTRPEEEINTWLGQFLTEPKHHLSPVHADPALSATEFLSAWKQAGALWRNSACRFLYISDKSQGSSTLFVNAEAYPLPAIPDSLIADLCSATALPYDELQAALEQKCLVEALCDLYNRGAYYINHDEQ